MYYWIFIFNYRMINELDEGVDKTKSKLGLLENKL